jgi:UDP-3-O-[3-hydroxymyristoyl] glucosamine N-acyltransferase
VYIEAGTVISEAVLGSSCRVGTGVTLNPGTVLASDAKIAARSIIPSNARVFYSTAGEQIIEMG